ncbi:hypothetical protein STIAU_5501 [Stigmatella aurantiaca DW4/3-1]|nr:hypothetical protein STIAU_5501 [Stigmatella aurantiaca DW4/3-1]
MRTPPVSRAINKYFIKHPAAWAQLDCRLAVRGDNSNTLLLPCVVSLLNKSSNEALLSYSTFPQPPRPWSERLFFYANQSDLNYGEIASAFEGIRSGGISDQQIASDMLAILGCKHVKTKYTSPQQQFLSGMVTLMFGMEASRFPSALLINLLLLDLIKYGKTYGRAGKKRFSFANAFRHGEGDNELHWDNGRDSERELGTLEHEWYGGKYPYAVHGTGSGNMAKRTEMTDWAEGGRLKSNFLALSQRHAVPRREVALVIHWAESNLPDEKLKDLTMQALYDMLLARLRQAYVGTKEEFKLEHDPRADTGFHRAMPAPEELSDKVFWYTKGKYYHVAPHCKLLPGYDLNHNKNVFLSEYALPTWVVEALGLSSVSVGFEQYEKIKGLSLSDMEDVAERESAATHRAKIISNWFKGKEPYKRDDIEKLQREITKRVTGDRGSGGKIQTRAETLMRHIKKLQEAGSVLILRGLPQVGTLEEAEEAEKIACLACIPQNYKKLVKEYRKSLESPIKVVLGGTE